MAIFIHCHMFRMRSWIKLPKVIVLLLLPIIFCLSEISAAVQLAPRAGDHESCLHLLHQKWILFESSFLWFKKKGNGKKSFLHIGVVRKNQCLVFVSCKVTNPVWTVWVGFWWILFCSCFRYSKGHINKHTNKFTYYRVHWTC